MDTPTSARLVDPFAYLSEPRAAHFRPRLVVLVVRTLGHSGVEVETISKSWGQAQARGVNLLSPSSTACRLLTRWITGAYVCGPITPPRGGNADDGTSCVAGWREQNEPIPMRIGFDEPPRVKDPSTHRDPGDESMKRDRRVVGIDLATRGRHLVGTDERVRSWINARVKANPEALDRHATSRAHRDGHLGRSP